jgi:phospholipase C
MMENRSFDHFLSWLPGADGRVDLTLESADGNTYRNYPLAPDFQGCGYSDPTTAGKDSWSSATAGAWTGSSSDRPRRRTTRV